MMFSPTGGAVTQIIGAIMLVVSVLSVLLAVVVTAAQRILKALGRASLSGAGE